MDIESAAEYGEMSQWKSAVMNGDEGPSARRAPLGPDCERGRRSSIASRSTKGRILIVDDDQFVRETLADLLEIEGYRPLQAADTLEALMILRQGALVDVLVTDLTMPGADGITLIRHARELRSDLPAILLTGYAEEVTSVTTMAGGNFHVLRKPVQTDRLVEQLELLMPKSQGC
jgi:CheY-like chemotaxis protein